LTEEPNSVNIFTAMDNEYARDAEEYLEILLDFGSLPETKSRRTLLEISGYPHYENVCSNILRFYFDPAAEHGLKDLLLSSFLKISGENDVPIPDDVSLIREHTAEDQKRIDLVINCETFTLGIENKIYHWEANDFENYGHAIDQLGNDKKKIKAVLCLNKADKRPLGGGFERYTYAELWQEVCGSLGNYVKRANPKWVTCLLDFMETTTYLAGANMELKKTDQFFIKHHNRIERMVTERNAFLERLNQKVFQLMTLMKETDEAKDINLCVYKSCLVFTFKFKTLYEIRFDLFLQPARPSDNAAGWELHIFGFKDKDQAYLEKLIKQPALSKRVSGNRVWGERFMVGKWGVEADLGEIREALRTWIQAIIEADSAEPH